MPFGPTMPIRSLRRTSILKWFSSWRRAASSPSSLFGRGGIGTETDRSMASSTSWPPPSAGPVSIFMVRWVMPPVLARSRRSASSSRSRPWLRLRRAEMPSRDHLVSAAILRSILCRTTASSARMPSDQSSNCAKSPSRRRSLPLCSQTMPVPRLRRKARSWLTTRRAPRCWRSMSSIHSMVGMSIWLVGSSRSRTSGSV